MRLRQVFFIALSVLLTTMSFGIYMNDEGAQVGELRNLIRHGDFDAEDPPPQFFAIFEGAILPEWKASTVESHALAAASAPAYAVLALLSPGLEPFQVLLALWAFATYMTIRTVWPAIYRAASGQQWVWARGREATGPWLQRWRRHVRRWTPGHWTLIIALGFWTLIQWGQQNHVAFDLWGEMFAIQTTTTLMTALAATLWYDLVRRLTDNRAIAAYGTAAFLLSPVLFWGTGIKYHGAAFLPFVAALWAYQRDDAWRYAAFPIALIGVWNSVFGLALLAALGLVEAIRGIATSRHDPVALKRTGIGGGLLAAGLASIAAYNQWAFGHWLGWRLQGEVRAELASGGLWQGLVGWVATEARFESWGVSLGNVWKVLFDARFFEGSPVSLIGITPLAILAFLSPVRAWEARSAPVIIWVAWTHSLVFLAAFMHGLHTQGSGLDPRFASLLTPGLLLLAIYTATPTLRTFGALRWRQTAVTAVAGAVSVWVALWALASLGLQLDAEDDRQLLQASYLLGIATAIALTALLSSRWRHLGKATVHQMQAVAFGLVLLAPIIWLTMTSLVVHREIPPWPFFSGADRMAFLLPMVGEFAETWTPRLIP